MRKDCFGIYVHVPFCVRKCNYCDFLSFEATDDVKTAYVKALVRQIKELPADDRRIASVFIGGGTPSILDAGCITDILGEIHRKYSVADDAEITIECNPGTLDAVKARAYKGCGVNRLSFGLQAVDNRLLKLIGRIHTYEKFVESYHVARDAGFENINVDMMSALPGQTLKGYLEGLETVAKLSPEHISAYSLIVEEGTQLYGHLYEYPALPDEDEERRMYHETCDLLESYGYSRYEISNYAKEDFQSRHNLSYWELTDYIGVGLGASGFYRGRRYSNTTDMKQYLSCTTARDYEDSYIYEVSNPNDRMEEFMFLGLRKTEGISTEEFASIFGKDIYDVYGTTIEKNCWSGLLEKYTKPTPTGTINYLRLTRLGIDVSNMVMSDFII